MYPHAVQARNIFPNKHIIIYSAYQRSMLHKSWQTVYITNSQYIVLSSNSTPRTCNTKNKCVTTFNTHLEEPLHHFPAACTLTPVYMYLFIHYNSCNNKFHADLHQIRIMLCNDCMLKPVGLARVRMHNANLTLF